MLLPNIQYLRILSFKIIKRINWNNIRHLLNLVKSNHSVNRFIQAKNNQHKGRPKARSKTTKQLLGVVRRQADYRELIQLPKGGLITDVQTQLNNSVTRVCFGRERLGFSFLVNDHFR